jgi:hypothetical protein
MADAKNLLSLWIGVDREKTSLYSTNPEMVIGWLNEANIRYCDKGEVIRDIWKPIIDSSGITELPDDFYREIKDRVKWKAGKFLTAMDFAVANIRSFTGTYYYSIWMHTFYVWAPSAGEPEIPYIRRPDDITVTNFANYELDIHREDHTNLLPYMDAMWARYKQDTPSYLALLQAFDNRAEKDGQDIRDKYEPAPRMRSYWF